MSSQSPAARRVVLLASIAILVGASLAIAGPLNPPAGSVSPSYKTLSEVEPRIAINATNTPGDADSSFRITAPGSYYLTGNITGVSGKCGIEIASSNVTIDLRGFSLQGVTGSLDAIRTNTGAFHKITIRDGSISNWGQDGIDLSQGAVIGASSLIEGIHSFQNTGDGIVGGYSSIIRDCSSALNGGRGIIGQDGSLIEDCAVRQSGSDGIRVERGSSVKGCVVQDSAGNGIHTLNSCAVLACTVTGNTLRGIFAEVGGGTISDCQASNNGNAGIVVSGGTVIARCSASFNGTRGFEVGTGAQVTGCTAHGNTTDGILAQGTPGYGCIILNNECSANGQGAGDGAGIKAIGDSHRIDGNNCTGNDRGVFVLNGGNFIVRNTCRANTANWDVVAGNVILVVIGAPTGGVTGNAGGSSPGTTDPNANFTY